MTQQPFPLCNTVNGVRLAIHVVPAARRNAKVARRDGAAQVSVTAALQARCAHAATVEVIAASPGVSGGRLVLVCRHAGWSKVDEVVGLVASRVQRLTGC